MNSGGAGAWRSRGWREAMPKPVSQLWPLTGSTRMFGWLQVLVNQLALMQLLECGRQTKGITEELPYLHGPVNQLAEGLASGIVTDKDRLLAVARKRERPSGPCRVQLMA